MGNIRSAEWLSYRQMEAQAPADNTETTLRGQALAGADELVALQREQMAVQRNPNRPFGAISMEFGRPEIIDELTKQANFEQVAEQAPPAVENGNTEGQPVNKYAQEVENVIKNQDGSYSVAQPWENGRQETKYFGADNKVDYTVVNFAPGQDGGMWRQTAYADPREHGGRVAEYEYERTQNGLAQQIEYDPAIAAKSGLGPVHFIRSYDADKNGGVAKEIEMQDGSVKKYDTDGKEIKATRN